jgi:hypothetical protein
LFRIPMSVNPKKTRRPAGSAAIFSGRLHIRTAALEQGELINPRRSRSMERVARDGDVPDHIPVKWILPEAIHLNNQKTSLISIRVTTFRWSAASCTSCSVLQELRSVGRGPACFSAHPLSKAFTTAGTLP